MARLAAAANGRVCIQANNSAADTFFGRVYVKNGGGSSTNTGGVAPRAEAGWLTDAQIDQLHRALDSKSMRIQPIGRPGQGQNTCIVGFTLVPRAILTLGIP